METKYGILTARVDPSLVARLDMLKIVTKKSRNQMITEAVSQYLAARMCGQAMEVADAIEALR